MVSGRRVGLVLGLLVMGEFGFGFEGIVNRVFEEMGSKFRCGG